MAVPDSFMRNPMQRKYAANAAHGARGEQGEKPSLLDCTGTHKGICCWRNMRAAQRAGRKAFPARLYRHAQGNLLLTQHAGLYKVFLYGGEQKMEWSLLFFFNSVLLGIGLAMDAFSVSLANGLHEPKMKRKRMCLIAGVFGFFQAFMPLAGWVCVHTIIRYFQAFEKLIPWIALILLLYIGGKMLAEGIRESKTGYNAEAEKPGASLSAILIQGIATSIDALSVGFTIAGYDFGMACVCALIIAAVTFFICIAGLLIGRRFGTRLSGKATLWGGVILIVIGLEIFINMWFS